MAYTAVFVLQHVHRLPTAEEDVKFIGVYSSEERANETIERLSTQPGFSETPDGFHLDRYNLDEDHWADGYATVT